MNKSLEAVRKAARKAIESIYYEGVCTIVEYQEIVLELFRGWA